MAGYLVLRTLPGRHGQRWDSSLVAFEAGTAAWAAGSERTLQTNHEPEAG